MTDEAARLGFYKDGNFVPWPEGVPITYDQDHFEKIRAAQEEASKPIAAPWGAEWGCDWYGKPEAHA